MSGVCSDLIIDLEQAGNSQVTMMKTGGVEIASLVVRLVTTATGGMPMTSGKHLAAEAMR